MQVIENWADIRGRVVSVVPDPSHDGQVIATIDVSNVADSSGFPNLLADAVGNQLAVNMPATQADQSGIRSGTLFSGRVRKAGPNHVFAHPDNIHIDNQD